MKKGSKLLVVNILFIFVVFTVVLLSYIGIKLENESMTKKKLSMEERLSSLKDTRNSLIAEVQYYSSEVRIVDVAVNELEMIRPQQSAEIKYVSKEKIEMINKILSEKYE